jgi:glutaminase
MNVGLTGPLPDNSLGWNDARPPLLRFLADCHAEFSVENSGAVADYIPELNKADPNHFGISLATLDGHVYEVGDTRIPFTIQSISKAFVFALALDTLGAQRVESVIGVEPSGEPFNSIRLNADNHPFNPMVNSGAIACSGLIHQAKGSGALECIRQALSRFAGRDLAVDEAVFASESATGDRNRAIGYLLRNSAVIQDDVSEVLEVYFRQCSILVTARDCAIMAATLANRGLNPITGEQVVSPYAITHTLSVMTSSGMYDFAGEWVYRVGIPAKSGVGGGILAALPAQLGLGSYSPRLDSHGNSVRGIKVCEALSAHFDLHMLNRNEDARNSIIADYDIGKSSSRRSRRPNEQAILADHHRDVRIIELVGALNFANIDFVSRQLSAKPRPQFLVFDLRRVAALTRAGARLLAEGIRELARLGVTTILSGVKRGSAMATTIGEWTDGIAKLRDFYLLDEAIEWAEDQIVYRHGGAIDCSDTAELSEQALLQGLTAEEIAALAAIGRRRTYAAGERIIAVGDAASTLYFLSRGTVNVKLNSGARLATLTAGMVFGEMALLEARRSADVWADSEVTCLEVPLAEFDRFRERHPRIGERIMRNLAQLLAERLIVANNRVNLLTANDREDINATSALDQTGFADASFVIPT